ncbi:DUF4054 domain-containing protein [Paraburkholderia bryophila]|uniref:DUF4054 domain-containing protein n=1 Tax=Paraburkholderia bryophila TaxID=420952 RepID=UPI00234BC6E7|nr:DUF4054 domain-containing protein [Paraburkholderia bryophila]WCM21364.1 DUF4054 domain-containing protein [Paraburkholderia bryophila]
MNPTQFRLDFPEFADPVKYPDSLIQMWLTVAASLVNAVRWAELTNIGIELITAHHLTIAARDQNAAAVGGVPGVMTGPTSAKAVDKVSTSYDTGAAALDNAGFWALTSYGIRYLSLARMMGAGGLQFSC